MTKDEIDNRADQLNPNNDAYYQSRGFGGRDDYYDDDGDAPCLYYSQYTPPAPIPSAFDEHAARVRSGIAQEMTAAKAGDIICAYLKNSYPSVTLHNESSARDVRVQVYGCAIDSLLADKLMFCVNQWIRTRRWMIERRIDDIALVFQERKG